MVPSTPQLCGNNVISETKERGGQMELKNFDNILSRVPKLADPLRVVLAGSDGDRKSVV